MCPSHVILSSDTEPDRTQYRRWSTAYGHSPHVIIKLGLPQRISITRLIIDFIKRCYAFRYVDRLVNNN
jgi:hypothetical protein